jgi:iron complex outermembrane receptor protein
MIKNCFLRLAAACFVTSSAFAQFKLEGSIFDNNGNLVPFALVSLDKSKAVNADGSGTFLFSDIRPGRHVFSASAVGFKSRRDTLLVTGDTKHDFKIVESGTQLDEVVVNATRVGEGSGMAYSDISAEEIKKQNLGQDVPYVLNQIPNVVVNSDAGNGIGYTGMRIRGTDATRINVTINGVPVNDAESQGTFFVDMPDLLSSVNSIQVQRGVGTSVNGAGAFGASINMQTNKLNEKAYGNVITTAGSFNTLRATVAGGTGLINGKYAFDARASQIKSDGYIDRASSNLKSYYLSGAFYGKKTAVKLINFLGAENTYQAWNFVSEENIKAGRRTFNELGYYTDEFGQEKTYNNQVDHYTQNNFQLHVIQQVNSRVNFNVIGHYTRGYGYYEEYRENDDPSFYGLGLPPIVVSGSDTISKTDLIRQRWLDNNFGGAVFNLNYRATSRLEFKLGGGYNSYFGKHFGDVIWSRYAGMSEKDHEYYFNTANKNDGNIYLKAAYNPTSRLQLFGDMQVRKVAYSYLGDDNADTLYEQLKTFLFFNPKLGFGYDLTTRFSVYGSAAVANKEPNRNDFVQNRTGTQPKAEELLDIEAGIRYKGDKLYICLNHYNMNYRNQLVLNGEINDVGASKRINVPVSYRRGFELELKYDINKMFSLAGSLCYSKNKIVEFTEYADYYDSDFTYEGNEKLKSYALTDISFSPDLVTSLQLIFKPVKRMEITFIHKYVGRQFLDNTGAVERSINPYNVVDVRANYTIPSIPEVSFMLSINNILNEVYETNGYTYNYFVAGTREVYNYYAPAAPLSFLAGVSLKF